MVAVSEGWALELRGEMIDLNDLRIELRPPFDPWVEDYTSNGESLLLLRTRSWEKLDSSADVMREARRLIEQINGAMLIGHADAIPINGGTIFRFDPDGAPMPVAIHATVNALMGRVRVRGFAALSGGGSPPLPAASPLQKRIERAGRDNDVADLLAFISRSDNWFDLFKAVESTEQILLDAALAGKSKAARHDSGETLARAMDPGWKDAKRTANVYRHAPSPKHTLPTPVPTLDEARSVVLEVARKTI